MKYIIESVLKDILILEDKTTMTLRELIANTTQYFPVSASNAIGFPYRFTDLHKVDYRGTKSVLFSGLSTSQTLGSQRYKVVLAFYDLELQEDNTFKLPSINTNPVRVRCNCQSYYFQFSYWNWVNNCAYGSAPKPYERKPGSTRPEVNPSHSPGICKHILAFSSQLIDNKSII
jgi:hypothetical protein